MTPRLLRCLAVAVLVVCIVLSCADTEGLTGTVVTLGGQS